MNDVVGRKSAIPVSNTHTRTHNTHSLHRSQTLYSQSAAARPGGALHRQPSVATSVDPRPFGTCTANDDTRSLCANVDLSRIVVWTSSGSIAVGAHHERLSTRITSQKGRHHQGHHQSTLLLIVSLLSMNKHFCFLLGKGAQRRKTQANEKRRRHQRQEIEIKIKNFSQQKSTNFF